MNNKDNNNNCKNENLPEYVLFIIQKFREIQYNSIKIKNLILGDFNLQSGCKIGKRSKMENPLFE